MWNSKFCLSLLFMSFCAFQSNASPIYLNTDNISVQVGAGTTATTSNNTFNSGATIDKVIDAPTAASSEIHSQSTHIWFSGGGLELLFDFGQQYDLTTLHFWNYNGESFDVDNIDFTFFDDGNNQVGMLSILPDLGTTPNIFAQDIPLVAPLNVQFVTAFLTGSNDQVDFQNIGFTATLSTDRCIGNPNDPICVTNSVPEPSSIVLLGLGVLGVGLSRRKRNKH
ncbi:PEP-CTERM sorting domain-containing protein [Porticoccus sp.]|uniref:PEP-CTERM sorting domain-containing protein n=1 Tax=Porticoccus sp. TaxID=2024853 RepID=UPI000C356508|nr:PEP-CTERM sorting domain-containing protein [Porticoccus sp.]MAZ69458.1 PEP-CTERM sorting domain-containing protein [Porticoccus sp.]|tara:strand:- start:22346 stop:23017 length:672 start_codon:yes stop_codon:yes gene_type:complete